VLPREHVDDAVEHEPAAGLQRRAPLAQHLLRARQFVIHIDHQDQVEEAVRQAGVGLRGPHEFHLVEPRPRDARAEQIEHLGLDVGSKDPSSRSDALRQSLGLQAGDTLVTRVRGDGREYQLNLYTGERRMAFSYRAPARTRGGEWIEVRIPLNQFEATSFGRVVAGAGPVDPGSVTSVGFLLAEKTPGPFALEVAWIKVLRGPGRR
jgi:hypothetical protein